MKITRSEFYSRAIKDYLDGVEDENLTQKLNSVYKDNPSKIDRRIHRAQLNALEKEEWKDYGTGGEYPRGGHGRRRKKAGI